MTTTPDSPDFRALAQELVDELNYHADECCSPRVYKLIARARAALATPPTVIEIIDLSIEIDDAGLGIVEFARAALERWGHG